MIIAAVPRLDTDLFLNSFDTYPYSNPIGKEENYFFSSNVFLTYKTDTMRKNIFIIALVILSASISACKKTSADPAVGDPQQTSRDNNGTVPGWINPGICLPKEVAFIADQNINIGTITVSNDATNISVSYSTSGGWVLKQTRLYVGDCALLPVNCQGNPMPEHFPHHAEHNKITQYTYQVPTTAIGIGNCGCIAAYAKVEKLNAAGHVIRREIAWGNGTRINPNGGNWGMKIDFCTCTP